MKLIDMKLKPFYILFLSVGILWACETPDPLIRDAQTALQIFQFEEALEYANQAIEQDSTNALGYYYRATALASIAEDLQPPRDRKPYYEDMRKAMENAKKFGEQMDRRPGELNNIDDIITNVWANEHNQGAEIMTDDSTRQATENPDETARDHFINATTVQPDSSISFVVLSSIQYQIGEVEEATRTYERAISIMQQPVYEDYEYLISLYFVQNRFEDARDLALKAIEEYPEETTFVQFLADTYLEIGETDKAVELIRDLIADDPENPQYYFVLGTQLFTVAEVYLNEAGRTYERIYQMQEQMSQLTQAEPANLENEIEELRKEAEEAESEGTEIMDMAVDEIKASLELAPEDDNAYNVLGIIYQNRAAALFNRRNYTLDNTLAMEFDEKARVNLRVSKQYYD
jgi:tetratricopeptide (TPR) repeat protein